LNDVLVSARAVVASVDLESLTGAAAAGAFEAFAELEKLGASGKLLVAPKIAASDTWARAGHRSPEEWMAKTSGTSVGQAKLTAETAKRVEELPSTRAALRSGELSIAQAAAVSEAALAKPDAEAELLAAARTDTVKSLQDKARRVVLDSRGSVEERYARQRRLRAFSTWTDDEGMTAGRFRLTPDAGAALVNRIKAEADRHYRKAYKEGRRESPENYAADALVGLVTGEGLIGTKSGSRGTEVVVLVSRESLERGTVDLDAGELCEIPGFGAIPVSRAREMLADCFLKAVVFDGRRVTHVKHFGRHRPADLDTALLVRTVLERGAVRCQVEGCDRPVQEWDHRLDFAKGGETSEANLNGYCRFDHKLKGQGRLVERGSRWFRVESASAERSPP